MWKVVLTLFWIVPCCHTRRDTPGVIQAAKQPELSFGTTHQTLNWEMWWGEQPASLPSPLHPSPAGEIQPLQVLVTSLLYLAFTFLFFSPSLNFLCLSMILLGKDLGAVIFNVSLNKIKSKNLPCRAQNISVSCVWAVQSMGGALASSLVNTNK